MADPIEKTCKKCGSTKPLTDFYIRQGRHQAQCKCCVLDANYAWRAANPEKSRAASKRWRERNPDAVSTKNREWREQNRDYNAERIKAWRQANPAAVAAMNKRYREASPERREAARRRSEKWQAENPDAPSRWPSRSPEQIRLRVAARRARKQETAVGPIDTEALWRHCDGRCMLCTELIDRSLRHPDPMSASLDHIVPLSKGGGHLQENLQWTHLICNVRKGSALPHDQRET